MAAYTSTQSGNFSNVATWGGGGYPNLDADTVTIAAGHTVTYDITTPLNEGLSTFTINAGGTLRCNANTQIRLGNGGNFICNGNFFANTGFKALLKGTTSPERQFTFNPTDITTTATGTSGQNTIVVASSANLIEGMRLSGTGIGLTARIQSISGTTVTLTENNTGTVSGTMTFGNVVEFVGTDGMPTTTINSQINSTNFLQGFINVTDSAQFATGDWVAFFKKDNIDALQGRNDEGYILHDKSGNDLYIREFVGPSATIVSSSGNQIVVSNAKIFRTWQALIFGTGANRNVLKISSIDTANNIITFTNSVVGSVVGQTVYTTGPLKTKSSGDRVRKVATTVAVQALSTATLITLSSVAGFSVGGYIVIDALWPGDSSYTDERPEKRLITAINGNVVTLDQSLGYIAYVGAFAVNMSRDIKIKGDYETTLTMTLAQSFAVGDVITQAFSNARGVVKTATTTSTTVVIQDIDGTFITGTTNSPFLSKNGTLISPNVTLTTVTVSTTQGHNSFNFGRTDKTTNYLSILRMKDIESTTFSNVGEVQSALYIRGSWSNGFNVNGGLEVEGISYGPPRDEFVYRQAGIYISRYLNDCNVRCNALYNAAESFRFNEGYNIRNGACLNNYAARIETRGILWQHMENTDTIGGTCELAYNYFHRCDDTGITVSFFRGVGRGIHHNWVNVSQGRAIDFDVTYNQTVLYQNRFENYFNPLYPIAGQQHILIYNQFIDATNPNDFFIDGGFQRHNQSLVFTSSTISMEHNYELDAVTVYIPNGKRVWDDNEKSWRTSFDDDSGTLDSGLAGMYYVPAGVSLKVRGTIKLDPAFNGTAPKLEVRDCMDRFNASIPANGSFAGDQPLQGSFVSTNFNAANITTYQSVEVTVPSKPWGRSVTAGIINVSSNASEGWWEKPVEVKYSAFPGGQFIDTGINNLSSVVTSGLSFTDRKFRLGGITI